MVNSSGSSKGLLVVTRPTVGERERKPQKYIRGGGGQKRLIVVAKILAGSVEHVQLNKENPLRYLFADIAGTECSSVRRFVRFDARPGAAAATSRCQIDVSSRDVTTCGNEVPFRKSVTLCD